jgi:alkyl hydroperoxide reductase subunit AhpC
MSSLRIGDEAPNFQAATSNGDIDFHKYIEGKWAILCSHPKDFTPVCTTEVLQVAKRSLDWKSRNTLPLVVSVDTADEHKAWVKDINEWGNVCIDFPIVEDCKRTISEQYGMLDQTNINGQGLPMTVRAVYFIAPDKKIKCIIVYPATTGRNFDELIRVLDSLQLTYNKALATPANWKKGQDCIISPKLSEQVAKEKYPNFQTLSKTCKIRTVKSSDV